MATTRVTRHIAASVFAAHAAVALSNARRDGHLEIALDSRDVIATAKGMLMAATDIAEEEAFTVLKRAPQPQPPVRGVRPSHPGAGGDRRGRPHRSLRRRHRLRLHPDRPQAVLARLL